MSIYVTGALLIVLCLCILGGLAFLYFYWWLLQRPVPRTAGELTLPCLAAPVQIWRDRHGIPHIQAENRADLFRAQGFVHAQDRLWQMEQGRRIAQGTLAALFGEPALQIDRYSRIVGFWRAAEAELKALDPEVRQVLEWYCEGVNGYMASQPTRLGAEFNLLRRRPAAWTPQDSLGHMKMMMWSLSVNWESELLRLQLALQMDPVRAAELEPDYPTESPVILEGVESSQALRLQSTVGLLLQQYTEIKGWLGPQGHGLGSNSWAVAPHRSLNGRPLLCSDPHLPITLPSIWYENHLQAPDYHVSGVIFPGLPGVMIGHNQEIAWGITNSFADVQDLYLERPHPQHPTRFAYGDEWEEAERLQEEIQVRGRPQPHVEEVLITRHGPLINGLTQDLESLPLALRWTGHGPTQNLRALLRLNQAHSWQEFDAALADWGTPPQNFVYADTAGNIGYLMAGQIPIRQNGLGLLPAPGWRTEHEWLGSVPHAELPRLFNPPSGLVVSANNKMVGDDYPYWLGAEYFPGWRAARIEELLAEKEKLTIRDMERIQLDTTSTFARALTPWLTTIYSDDPWEKSAIAALRSWGGQMESDSDAALVFHFALLQLLEMTFGDKLGAARAGYLGQTRSPLFIISGFMQRSQTRLLELLNSHAESPWYHDARTGKVRSRDELLQEAIARAVTSLRKEVGDSARRWAWGRLHQVRYAHPLGSVRLFSGFLNRGPFPVPGDGTTPNQSSYAANLPPGLVQIAASYRQLYEVGAWDRAVTVTPSGQSGHPLSPHYDDQMAMWREGVYHRMPWTQAAIEEITAQRLRLLPSSHPSYKPARSQ